MPRACSSSELLPGTLDMLVLQTLTLQSLHGYAIAQHIRRLSDSVLSVEQGSLYPALERLQRKGWVTSKWGETPTKRRARYYTITVAGRKQLGNEIMSFDDVAQDLRYALRACRRAPGFTLAATLTLALGIGATTAVFSIVDGVLVRGLPYRDADRVVDLWETSDNGGYRLPSYPTFKDWRSQSVAWNSAFERMAFVKGAEAILVGEKGPERFIGSAVSPGFFELLGTPAFLGRTFLPDEERAGANRVAVLSYALWQRRFGGDPAIVGKTISVSSAPTTIIGVMPRGFAFPSWADLQLWRPIAEVENTDSSLSKRGVHTDSRTIGRLRAGADSARVSAVMRTVEQRLAQAYPAEQSHWTSAVMLPIREEVLGNVKPTLLMLAGATGLVLLLACANVANLLLVRAASRERELAVRAAIGAGRTRLMRQLLVESLTLAGVGGALGIAFAVGLVRIVRLPAGGELPRSREIVVEGGVTLFAVAASRLFALLARVGPPPPS